MSGAASGLGLLLLWQVFPHSRPQSRVPFGQRHGGAGQKERGSGDENGISMCTILVNTCFNLWSGECI